MELQEDIIVDTLKAWVNKAMDIGLYYQAGKIGEVAGLIENIIKVEKAVESK